MDKVIILFSGGVDSTLLATLAHKQGKLGALLFVDYGQPAARMEAQACHRWAEAHDVELICMGVRMHGLETAMYTGVGEPGPRILPGRNMVLIAHAVNAAAALGCWGVWYGATGEDTEYPDCQAAWVAAMNATTQPDTGVEVSAPLIEMSKAEVLTAASALGVDLAATWSCYQPRNGNEPCGECNSCKQRNQCA